MDDARRRRYLEELGITPWVRRGPPVVESAPELAPEPPPELAPESPVAEVATLDWQALSQRVAECTACALYQGRTRTVFGVGDPAADWLVVGEAPGAEEDRQGEPFVGRAGQLLDAMLAALGLARGQGVYIANCIKCRPPDNRDPLPEERAACAPWLARQIALIRPRVILAVGRVAAQHLLATETPLGKLRGQVHHWGAEATPLVVTYHPAYLLRKPTEKARAWEDLKRARAVLGKG